MVVRVSSRERTEQNRTALNCENAMRSIKKMLTTEDTDPEDFLALTLDEEVRESE